MCKLRTCLRRAVWMMANSLWLTGCYVRPAIGPIPVKIISALQLTAVHPLVIVLPGRGDNLHDLEGNGIVQAIHSGWPQADVLLTGATIHYYMDGGIARRLHEQIIVPARARGYQEIWLAGASMGGMGVLLYERKYPDDVTGLVMFAPYMGDMHLEKQLAAADGPRYWDPGPVPVQVSKDDYQTELWRVVKSWSDVKQAQRIWLACGSRDRLLPASRLMASLLPANHFIEPAGGHSWKVWNTAARQIFARIAAQTEQDRNDHAAGR